MPGQKQNLLNHIDAAEIAKRQDVNDLRAFVLKNPLKLSREILQLVANQITFNQIISHKIPAWAKYSEIIAPEKVSLEQSSSEWTAKYKSDYVSGKLGADLTGGLGVDAFFLSQKFEKYIHNEPNGNLSEIVAFNFKKMGKENVSFTQLPAEEFPIKEAIDYIYLDPSRRDLNNRKMVGIQDCSPDLSTMIEDMVAPNRTIMVKYSPMLDIKAGIMLLKYVHQVLILSEKNEVKELVFIIRNSKIEFPEVKCINLTSDGITQEFSFDFSKETIAEVSYSEPKAYIYESNAAIMKAGAFKSVSAYFGLDKIAVNSHLYTSEKRIDEFPGRKFLVSKVLAYDKKILSAENPSGKANIAVRNFPLSAEEIKKQLKWQDGGDIYLFFTENSLKKKIVIFCKKIQ